MGKRSWGVSVILLGCWEAAAFATGRVPTVSYTVRWGTGRRGKRLVQAAVVGYMAGAAHHLLH